MASECDDGYWELSGDELALVAEQIRTGTPGLVALCEVERDHDSGDLVGCHVTGWGLVFTDRILTVDVEGTERGTRRCDPAVLERTMNRFGRASWTGDVGVVWLERVG